MQRTKWIDGKFNHDLPLGWLPNVMERLHGTVIRLNSMVSALTDEQLSTQLNGKWSIKQHVGHLIDLEEVNEGRIDDFKTKKEILRGADMSNRKTHEADCNTKSIQQLVQDFRLKRDKFIYRLEELDEATYRHRATHPRLQIPMKPIDMAFFTAEHDDHHLADIREILRKTLGI